jgi:cell division septum initiation protein DivIVA
MVMEKTDLECKIATLISRIAVLETKHKELSERFRLELISQERALKIQTRELERRLEALNGEADRLRSMQATYIPREVYDIKMAAIDKVHLSLWVGGLLVLIAAVLSRFFS